MCIAHSKHKDRNDNWDYQKFGKISFDWAICNFDIKINKMNFDTLK